MDPDARTLGTIGVWAIQLRSRDRQRIAEVASTLDELGYGTLWIPGGSGGDVFGDVDTALDATTRAVVATGILNIWMHPASKTASWHACTRERHPGRMVLGLGNSHTRSVEATDRAYTRPYSAMVAYLAALDAAPSPVPVQQCILAALGPKMLDLAARRSLGAHQYSSTPPIRRPRGMRWDHARYWRPS